MKAIRPKAIHVRSGTRAGAASAALSLLLAGCGGGGSDPSEAAPAAPSGPTVAERSAAAAATAQSAANACSAIRPFYWEIGDRAAALASGSVGGAAGATIVTAATPLAIASASKWLYGAYVAERRGGALNDDDIRDLTLRSGYTAFLTCLPNQTVQQCEAFARNGDLVAAHVDRFAYGGGHMQRHATTIGLGPLDNAALAGELRSQLGSDVALAYRRPQLGDGVVTTAADYAVFLRRILAGTLRMHELLGTHAVCTNPATCSDAVSTPIPASESWHYSIGHWVEDDPAVGDGAFSSPGRFGFYPWIDAAETHYGIVARTAPAAPAGSDDSVAFDSVQCGRLVRKAWATATAG